MEKKNGGKIENWQLHHIEIPEESKEKFKQYFPDVIIPPILFTGTLVDDPTGRWQPGYHMRSTYCVSFDRDTGVFETLNTIYTLDMETEGQDVIPDIHNDVLKLSY